MNEDNLKRDELTRWLDRGASLRVVVADALNTARGICLLHDLQGNDARDLSHALVGVLLLASDLKSSETFSVQIEIDERVFHVDATPEGLVRAMVTPRAHGASVARMAVRRFGQNGILYQSVVDIPSLSVEAVLDGYVSQSEQLPVRVDLRCELDAQGLPETAHGALVRGFPATPRDILSNLFAAWERRGVWKPDAPCGDLDEHVWDRLSRQAIRHHCPCSRERALVSIRALGEEHLRDAAEKGETMEVICDFCRSAYVFAPEEFSPPSE